MFLLIEGKNEEPVRNIAAIKIVTTTDSVTNPETETKITGNAEILISATIPMIIEMETAAATENTAAKAVRTEISAAVIEMAR